MNDKRSDFPPASSLQDISHLDLSVHSAILWPIVPYLVHRGYVMIKVSGAYVGLICEKEYVIRYFGETCSLFIRG